MAAVLPQPLVKSTRKPARKSSGSTGGRGQSSAFAPWILPVLLIAGWQAASQLGWLSSRILPEPWAVAKAFWTLAVSGELWVHLRTSLWRAISGFAIGAGLGLSLIHI